jgi:segregation and condensation protein A
VDLTTISVLALAEQYLVFIAHARKLRLELAADYLVMAAWLAYLKSKLLLPREASTADHPRARNWRRAGLPPEAARGHAQRGRHADDAARLGRDVFPRGMPEGVRTIRVRQYTAVVYDLLKAYAEQRSRTVKRVHVVPRRTVWSIKDARERLQTLIGAGRAMGAARYVPRAVSARPGASPHGVGKLVRRHLEMARDGLVELSQAEPFAPIYMRKREDGAEWQRVS